MEEKEQIVKCLRGICVSSKGLLSLRQLKSDYYAIIGENVPFQKLGYKRLEDFIKDANSLDLVVRNGESFVQARVTEQSAHISEMVRKQKSVTKKKGPTRVRFHVTNHTQRAPPRYNHTAAASTHWRPKYSGDSWKKYQDSSRPKTVSHAQFVEKIGSKVVPSQTYKPVDPSRSQKVVQSQTKPVNQIPPIMNNSKPAVNNVSSVNQNAPKKPPEVTNTRLNQNRFKETPLYNKELHMTNGATHPANLLLNAQNRVLNDHTKSYLNDYTATSQGTSHTHTLPPAPKSPLTPITPVFEDINPLLSRKKTITRMMSELSIERDSGNCSPVSDISPPSPCKTPEEFPRTGDPMADLKGFAELYKLGEVEVSTNTLRQKRGATMITCAIKIGKEKYVSYPNEFTNEKDAQNYCCETALADLIPKYQRRKSLLISSEKDILERIPVMIEKHQNGIWASQLRLDYADKYNEQLPPDWLKIADSSQSVQIDKLGEDYVLCHCNPSDGGDECKSGLCGVILRYKKGKQRRSLGVPISNVSVPSNTVEFGEDGRLIAQVMCTLSANEIWLQQVQTQQSENYTEINGRMEVYYGSRESQLIPVSIAETGYYVAKYEGNYYRVRAINVDDTEVNCFFIDYGDELSIPKDAIFELKREYATVQAQAFVVRLAGLEDLYDTSCNSESLQEIVGKVVNVEMAVDHLNSEEGESIIIPVYMYDLESGSSINEELISKLTMESASPKLNLQQEKVIDVYVSNIEANGDVYVQLRTYGFERFKSLRENLETEITANPPKHLLKKVTKRNSAGKLYFAKNQADGKWYRIQLIDWSPDGVYAQIYYVDVGNTDVITVDKEILYPLESLSDIVNQYPPQATKVRLTGLDLIPEDFKSKASKVIPTEEAVLLKLEDLQPQDGIALVELFRRNSDESLFSINRSIAMERELEKGKTKPKLSPSNSGLVPSSGTLPSPMIPDKDEFFTVSIPFAVNPYNFFVQPLDSEAELDAMMNRLQQRYSHVTSGKLKVDDIVPGNIYASLHEDKIWYRTSVIKVIHSGSVSVYFCDFGYYQNLTVQQLVPLDDEFLKLPYQALKAKLADIKPKHNKWSMDDCDQFKEMVEKKNFYSRIKEIEKDILYESDVILKLELIDTSTNEDIFIDKLLISKDIAVEA